MSERQPIDLDDLQRVGTKVRELTDDNWLADMVEIACEEIALLREERRWIPVGERLPPTDAEVLFTCEIDGDFIGIYMGRSTGRMNDIGSAVIMDLDGDSDWVPCTHWQPQPKEPNRE
jgi:hypothetical protein